MAMYPSFFKTVLGHALEEGTLELPRSFVKEHGKNLSNYAYLKVPTGAKSKVELKMDNRRAWLHQGWKDFVEKYSIKCGYFLVFQYEAPSHFDVLIFDLTCSEIEYTRPSRKRKMEMTNQYRESRSRQQCSSIENKSQGTKQVQRAKALQSPNLVFTVTMKPSYVCHAAYLHIPTGPASDFFREKGNDRHSIDLHLNGTVWSMNCYFIGAPSHPQVRISLGWPKFKRENNLQKGDACSFELVNSRTMDFKVTISRKNDEEQLSKTRTRGRPIRVSPQCADTQREATRVERAESFKSENPHFKITMIPYYISDKANGVYIPSDYPRKYIEEDEHGEQVMVVVHGSSGKTWPLRYFFSTKERAFLSRGWKDFAIDNRLKVGDACIFERIDGKAKKYKVHIFRKADQA